MDVQCFLFAITIDCILDLYSFPKSCRLPFLVSLKCGVWYPDLIDASPCESNEPMACVNFVYGGPVEISTSYMCSHTRFKASSLQRVDRAYFFLYHLTK